MSTADTNTSALIEEMHKQALADLEAQTQAALNSITAWYTLALSALGARTDTAQTNADTLAHNVQYAPRAPVSGTWVPAVASGPADTQQMPTGGAA